MIDEPVQRYLTHAIAERAPRHSGVLSVMRCGNVGQDQFGERIA